MSVRIVGTMTSKGQITIPAEVRRRLELKTGSKVVFKLNDEGPVEIASSLQEVRAVYGSLPLPPGMTGTQLAAMGKEIGEREAVERYRRSLGLDSE